MEGGNYDMKGTYGDVFRFNILRKRGVGTVDADAGGGLLPLRKFKARLGEHGDCPDGVHPALSTHIGHIGTVRPILA
jgi:hypothetical protein